MKIRKNALMLTLIASLLLMAIMTVPTMYAVSTPIIAAPTLIRPDLGYVGATFSTDITIAAIPDANMWGYTVYLTYDTSILTATGYASYDPFTTSWPSEINDAAGYATISYSMALGETQGFNTTDPAPICRIDWEVDAVGTTDLIFDQGQTTLSDTLGGGIPITTFTDGFFDNTPKLTPVADFTFQPTYIEATELVWFDASASYHNDLGLVIVDYEWDFGDGWTGTGMIAGHPFATAGNPLVTLTVRDDIGQEDTHQLPVTVRPKAKLAAPHVSHYVDVGSVFSYDITVDDVAKMWGYEFTLTYDTSILTATTYGSLAPFTEFKAAEINDAAGYVMMSYSAPFGDPDGLTATTPTAIATIQFSVDSVGSTNLEFADPHGVYVTLSDVLGEPYLYSVSEGSFTPLFVKTRVDVYTEKVGVLRGQGDGVAGSAFARGELVTLHADVEYAGVPIGNALVAYSVYDPAMAMFYADTAITDLTGHAEVTFRMPADAEFGVYTATAAVSVFQEVDIDSLTFRTGYIIDFVEAPPSPDPVARGNTVDFAVIVENIDPWDSHDALIVLSVKDSAGVVIGFASIGPMAFAPGTTPFILSVPIPATAIPGLATATFNAWTDLPLNGGTPYCPAFIVSFTIS